MNPVALELSHALIASNPARAALKVEGYPTEQIAELLTALGSEAAAVLLRHLVPLVGAEGLGAMEPRAGARLLERMGPQRAVILLGRMNEPQATSLLNELPAASQATARRMLEYRSDQAGRRMDPRAPAVSPQATAEHAHDLVRRAADSALHYVYVVDDEHRLVGVVSMRELMLSPPDTQVSAIMTGAPECIVADDLLQNVVVNPGWRRTHALPVVDEQGRFLGVIRYSVFRTIEAELGQSRSGPNNAKTAEALAELLWLGTSAVGRMTGAAILGAPREDDQS